MKHEEVSQTKTLQPYPSRNLSVIPDGCKGKEKEMKEREIKTDRKEENEKEMK